ncbi:hypothetical protein Tco_1250890 [Tanacetum coccineum]
MVSIRVHRFPFLVKMDNMDNWNRFNCNSRGANPVRVMASGAIDINHKMKSMIPSFIVIQVPDIIDNTYVIIEFENGARGMLDLFMFAKGSKNEQEIYVIGKTGKKEKEKNKLEVEEGHVTVAIGVEAQLSIEKETFVSINEVMS